MGLLWFLNYIWGKQKEPVYTQPTFLGEGYIYQPRAQAVKQNGIVETFNIGYKDIYTASPCLESLANAWKSLPHDQKLLWIWKYVIEKYTYEYDQDDSWQLPQITFYRTRGDCDDVSVLFLTLCKLCGIPPTDVFLACGIYKVNDELIGHAFPIAKMLDGSWYVFEATLDVTPDKPKLFKGSNYMASWGLQNWMFMGAIKEGDKNGWQI